MKSLTQYIFEYLDCMTEFTDSEAMKMLDTQNYNQTAKDFIRCLTKWLDNVICIKSSKQSLTAKTTTKKMFSNFVNYANKNFGYKIIDYMKDTTSHPFLNSPEYFTIFLLKNMDLINAHAGKDIFTANMSTKEKEYKKWKNSILYTPLEDYDPNKDYNDYYEDIDDDKPMRAFVIYYAYDPSDTSLVKVFWQQGETTDLDVKHNINMHKVDWTHETGKKYYNANPCLVSYYRKSGKSELIKNYYDNLDFYDK